MTEKEQFLRKFNEAFASGDIATITESVTDHIRWVMVGDQTIEGKNALAEALESMVPPNGMTMSIDSVITHGREAAVHGIITMKDEAGADKTYAFCDVYRFNGLKNGKISELTSFVIEMKSSS